MVLTAALLGLLAWRVSDDRHANRVWLELKRRAETSPPVFDPSMVAGLPEPARRFLLFTIKPGAPLATVAEIRMRGEIALGTREQPNYLAMHGEQILAPPQGLVWKCRAGKGVVRIVGSDGLHGEEAWTRFWLFGAIPVARVAGGVDLARSAFGRLIAESVFFAPAALLPANGTTWAAGGRDTARAVVEFGRLTQTVDISVYEDGRPSMVVIPRWSDANASKTYRIQPFGGYVSDFREFQGYTLPTKIEGGNFIGTEEYFPFYKAAIDDIRFILPD